MDVELTYRKWVEKVTEKLTFIHLKIKEKSELTEADYELMRVLHSKIWRPGEFPIYTHENLTIKPDEVATQQGLFSANMTDNTLGTEVELLSADNLKERKMRRSWIDDDLADVFDSLFPVKSYSAVWRLYNPQEYELKPKKNLLTH